MKIAAQSRDATAKNEYDWSWYPSLNEDCGRRG